MTNEYNYINDQASSNSGVQILTSSNYLDHVYSYVGQNYNSRDSSVLRELNKISRRNGLLLHRSQSTNRDVRILLPTQIEIAIEDAQEMPAKHTRFNVNRQPCSPTFTSKFNRLKQSSNDHVDENEDDALILGQVNCYSKPETNYRRFENKNYQTFVFNFNKIAAGCYLKVLQAPQEMWQLYSLDKQIQIETNFSMINQSCLKKLNNYEERRLYASLSDREFISNYTKLMIKMHNDIVNKLYIVLNAPTVRFHFQTGLNKKKSSLKTSLANSKKNQGQEPHLFRSFRILGLRQEKNKFKKSSNSFRNYRYHSSRSKNDNNNCYDQENSQSISEKFSDIVDIRSAFDIRQFQNKSGYDCFIECEMSYYKIQNESTRDEGFVPRRFENETLKQDINDPFSKSDFMKKKKVLNRVEESQIDSTSSSSENEYSDDLNSANHFLERDLISENNIAFRYTDNDLKEISRFRKRKPINSKLGNLRSSKT